MWPFKSLAPVRRRYWNDSQPLLGLSDDDVWTIGDSYQGSQVWGSTGSGKTTTTVAELVRSFLWAGYGGIFLTTKPSDRKMYEGYCRETGRLRDLVLFGPEHPARFNPLDAELSRRDAGAGLTQNVAALLGTLLEVGERQSGDGDSQDGYFRRANQQLMRNAIDLLVMATGRLSVPDLYRLIVSAPMSLEQAQSEAWQRSSFCFQCLHVADAKRKSPESAADFRIVADYFLLEFAGLANKTRSCVVSTFTSMIDVLHRSTIRTLMSGPVTTCSPEIVQDGAIILIDMPIKVFGESGVFCQLLWKLCFQMAQERRDIAKNPRPAFLVSDESHLLSVKADQLFQTTARSSRTAVVYATQSISNYLEAFGANSEARVHSLLGNLQTQWFHQQTDIKTNAYASELIGRSRQFLMNAGQSHSESDWFSYLQGNSSGQYSAGVSEVFEWEVQPRTFTTLRKGGPPKWEVDLLVYQGGRQFRGSGRPWLPVTFRQRF